MYGVAWLAQRLRLLRDRTQDEGAARKGAGVCIGVFEDEAKHCALGPVSVVWHGRAGTGRTRCGKKRAMATVVGFDEGNVLVSGYGCASLRGEAHKRVIE